MLGEAVYSMENQNKKRGKGKKVFALLATGALIGLSVIAPIAQAKPSPSFSGNPVKTSPNSVAPSGSASSTGATGSSGGCLTQLGTDGQPLDLVSVPFLLDKDSKFDTSRIAILGEDSQSYKAAYIIPGEYCVSINPETRKVVAVPGQYLNSIIYLNSDGSPKSDSRLLDVRWASPHYKGSKFYYPVGQSPTI
jgi:hypothetical protein